MERPAKEIWERRLESAGYPTDCLILDFESYFDTECSLGKNKLSVVEYIHHPKFRLAGLGWSEGPDTYEGTLAQFVGGKERVDTLIRHFQDRFGENLERVTVIAQNCKFDMMILALVYGIYPPFTVDTYDLHAHIDARSSKHLKHMAKEYKLPAKGDTMDFKGLYWEDMTDEQKEAYEEYCIKDIKLESHLFCEMFKLFSRPEIEIHLAHHTLELYTRPQLVFDKELGKDLIIRMRRELNTSLERTGFTEKELSGDLSFAKIMIDAMPEGETIPLKKGKPTKNMIPMTGAGMIPAFAKDDEGMVELQHHPSQQVRNLANARIELNSWPNWIKRLKSIGVQSKLLDGYFPIPLVYYGGHTGRGSGTEKINVQNLGATKAHKLVQAIRHTMRAPEGSLLCISDLSAIEARMLAWMAQEQQLLDIYYVNGDVYIAFASKLFKFEVTKKDNPIERGVGKTTILGCGYGMGWKTFLGRLVVLPELQERVMLGEINKAYSKRAIDTYRATYQRIPDYWAELESAFRWVTKYPRKTREVHPGLRLWCEGHLTHIKLPNDRILYYPQSRVKATYNSFGDLTEQIRWRYGPTWGGSLTENVDQALARDILMEALLRWEQTSKYRVALHVHDELMSVVPKEDAEEALAMLNKCMTVVPKWAEGLPLDAEGFISEYYKK